MNKKLKISIILSISAILLIYWLGLFVTHTKYHMVNYWWQIILAVLAIVGGFFGMVTAKHWSWLKSGVGKGVFFVSLGVVMWGIGQAGWSYFVIKDPSQQVPPTHILDVIYFSSIPLWMYGMLQLSKATGAKFALKKPAAKILIILWTIIMVVVSYYLLVVLARGGTKYFHQNTFWEAFFDLGYAIGDAINITLALAIFGLSWEQLGGRFKRPIVGILSGFLFIFLADLLFSYYDGKGVYYNGHWTDLLYLLMVTVFAVALCMLDPTKAKAHVAAQTVPISPETPAQAPVIQ
jgi:hypothetical protein